MRVRLRAEKVGVVLPADRGKHARIGASRFGVEGERIPGRDAGPSSAVDVMVTDSLPSPLTFVSSRSGCTAAGQVVTCTRASVVPGTTATFDLLVRLDPAYVGDGSDLVNTATVASSTPDATPDNNQPAPAPPPPVGIGEADVTVSKTGPYGVAPAGGEITYTIVVTNQGFSVTGADAALGSM
jgi:hypothetical protein